MDADHPLNGGLFPRRSTGGLSKWNILHDEGLSDRIPEVFGTAPEVLRGVMLSEAQAAWRQWSPFAWEMIRLRGLLTAPLAENGGVLARPAQRPSLCITWRYC